MGSHVLRVGLTGNIAAGKSTVAAWMAQAGFRVLDADKLGHRCLEAGAASYERVIDAFGGGIVGADGNIDRRALGKLVFDDDDARRRLEKILHPAIREHEQRFVDELVLAQEPAVAVTEAALLYETGSAGRYQRMVVVVAPDSVRLDRLMRRGLDVAAARARMEAQMDQAEKAARADYVIDNGGTLEEARTATADVCEHLRRDLMLSMGGSPLG